MTKINFTPEHKARLDVLLLAMLFGNLIIASVLGTTITAQSLLNECTMNTLQTLLGNLKRAIENLENLDAWSMSSNQQKKLKELKDAQELVNLTIGYRKWMDQVNSEKQQIKALKAELAILKASTATPEEKMKALTDKIAAMGGSVDDPANETAE